MNIGDGMDIGQSMRGTMLWKGLKEHTSPYHENAKVELGSFINYAPRPGVLEDEELSQFGP